MRRSIVLALVTALLSATGVLALATGAGAGDIMPPVPVPELNTTIIVRKVVVGTATAGSTVHLSCEDSSSALLNFDAAGHPTTSVPADPDLSIVDGAWQIQVVNPDAALACDFTEVVTGGATTTSWTCAYSSTEPPVVKATGEVILGCAAASGAGTGPATVTYGNFDDNVETQTSTVTFTNEFVATSPTVVADPVVVGPAFTG